MCREGPRISLEALMLGDYPVGDGIGSDSPVATSHVWSRIALRTMLEPSGDQLRCALAPIQQRGCCPSILRPEPSGCMSQTCRTNGSPPPWYCGSAGSRRKAIVVLSGDSLGKKPRVTATGEPSSPTKKIVPPLS